VLDYLLKIWQNITQDQAAQDQLIKELDQRVRELEDRFRDLEWQVQNNK